MSLIKNAQLQSTLTEAEVKRYTELSVILNKPFNDIVLEGMNTIQPADYQEWLRVVSEVGQEQNIDLTNQAAFQDLAFELLDNDPKVDAIGNSEDTKNNIVNTLWHAFNTSNYQQKADMSNQAGQVEDEESSTKSKKKAMAPTIMDTIHTSPTLQKVYKTGELAGNSDMKNADQKPCKSPYATGTYRDKVWKLGHRHGCVGK